MPSKTMRLVVPRDYSLLEIHVVRIVESHLETRTNDRREASCQGAQVLLCLDGDERVRKGRQDELERVRQRRA